MLYTHKLLFLNNTKISIFGGISKFHLWEDFGKFGQFWADFADSGWQHAPTGAEILKTS
jgi:hypothetical protein